MRYPLFCLLILAIGLCFVPVAVAQSQPAQPAVTNPPRYADSSPSDRSPSQALPDQGAPPASQAVPPELTLPAGTLVTVRLTETLSSDHNIPGDGFTAVLEQPLVAQGWVVSRRGQMAVGRVATAQKAGRVQGVSQLAVELSELVMVDGRQVSVRTQLIRSAAGTSNARDAVGVGTSAGVGATIGAAAGGGEGAAIGAAAGAVAGIVGVLTTRGRATELYPETILTFRLEEPVSIPTQESMQAFRPVSQQDYSGNDGRRNVPRTFRAGEAYPPPPPYYYSPYYPGYWYYGYYGFGPGVFWGPRVIIGGRGFYRHHR